MKFLRLDIENFLTVGKAVIDLNDRGLVLIQGENIDDSSASSNGAGKSSIVDALCWVVFGTTARGVSSDAVVNSTAKKNTVVSLTIEDDGNIYKVVRHRKHTTNKNALMLSKVCGGVTRGVIDMTKGTEKETQALLTTIIGCSYDVFTSSVYAGQEKMPDLPAMTDKMLKMLIEEAAGVQVLEAAHVIAKREFAKVKATSEANENRINTLKARGDDAVNHLKSLEATHKNFEDGRKDRARDHLKGVIAEQEKIKNLNEEKSTAESDRIRASILDTENQIKKIAQDQDSYNLVKNKHYDQSLNRNKVQAVFDNKKSIINGLIGEIKTLDKLVGSDCKECGKEICSHDLESTRAAKLKTVKAEKVEYETVRDQLEIEQQEQDKLNAELSALHVDSSKLSTLNANLRTLNGELVRVSGIDGRISACEANIETIKQNARKCMVEPNPHETTMDSVKHKIAQFNQDISELELQQVVYDSEVAVRAKAVQVFGSGGVRAHVLDTVTPFLNEQTREYLGALSDGNIHATWTTLTKSAKGELKEKFSINVVNDKGASSFQGLSGGEKRKVRLATCLALQDLVASRATKPIELFVGDEIDDALDNAGLERLMAVLERKARERGTVLVISHNELRDFIDLAIDVRKDAGYSTVSGDTLKVT